MAGAFCPNTLVATSAANEARFAATWLGCSTKASPAWATFVMAGQNASGAEVRVAAPLACPGPTTMPARRNPVATMAPARRVARALTAGHPSSHRHDRRVEGQAARRSVEHGVSVAEDAT